MSEGIRQAIKAELEIVSERQVALAAELEQVESRIQQLEDLDEQAKQLDEEVPASTSPGGSGQVPPAAPAPRRRATTSAGRRSQPQRADKAHTAKGASTGGRRDGKPPRVPIPDAAELGPKIAKIVAESDDPVTVAEIIRSVGGPTKGGNGSKWGERVREVLADLLKAGDVVPASPGRGGHPRYTNLKVRPRERAIPLPPGRANEGSNVIDKLVDKIVETLEVDGGRVARQDLKDRVGDPGFEDFELALDRAVNLNKIVKTKAGGVVGYEGKR